MGNPLDSLGYNLFCQNSICYGSGSPCQHLNNVSACMDTWICDTHLPAGINLLIASKTFFFFFLFFCIMLTDTYTTCQTGWTLNPSYPSACCTDLPWILRCICFLHVISQVFTDAIAQNFFQRFVWQPQQPQSIASWLQHSATYTCDAVSRLPSLGGNHSVALQASCWSANIYVFTYIDCVLNLLYWVTYCTESNRLLLSKDLCVLVPSISGHSCKASPMWLLRTFFNASGNGCNSLNSLHPWLQDRATYTCDVVSLLPTLGGDERSGIDFACSDLGTCWWSLPIQVAHAICLYDLYERCTHMHLYVWCTRNPIHHLFIHTCVLLWITFVPIAHITAMWISMACKGLESCMLTPPGNLGHRHNVGPSKWGDPYTCNNMPQQRSIKISQNQYQVPCQNTDQLEFILTLRNV